MRTNLRWGVLVLTPYAVVPLLAALLGLPSLALWQFVATHGLTGALDDVELALGMAVSIVIAVAAWYAGTAAALRLIGRRHDRLVMVLDNPDLG